MFLTAILSSAGIQFKCPTPTSCHVAPPFIVIKACHSTIPKILEQSLVRSNQNNMAYASHIHVMMSKLIKQMYGGNQPILIWPRDRLYTTDRDTTSHFFHNTIIILDLHLLFYYSTYKLFIIFKRI